ncbi:hypothetical protein KTR66_16195 [Roseococcus sp. SDR]|uniref:hypothetical protein n=1 Tax=Roseococcus sp. SDR TaxID=2835532 RepID=UPI001BCD8713|nr:hypothetical protein [Roseococcus sp. SDR]MBS7791544.1 hypothetical protein [Roseococcus sp. SDR]MBV1846858.1 hypothetical protein [Roseococcus sp. SDR]
MRNTLLLLPLIAAACAGGEGTNPAASIGCSGQVLLRNIGPMAVEQAFFSAAGPGNWGRDLLTPTDIPPGGDRTVMATPGRNAVRIVFANGRAAEMPAMDVCTSGTLTISPTELIASQ